VKTWRLDEGSWTPEATVSPCDRGFRYGMSFFETIAIHHRRGIFLGEHLKRLASAVDSVGGKIDVMMLGSTIPELVVDLENGVLRVYVTAGPGAFGEAFAGEIFAIFEAMKVGGETPSLRLATSAAPYVARPGGWKTGNYWRNIEALLAARGSGCDEVLLFDPAGSLVSAAMGNVFLCVDGRWVTPPLGAGARDGVVRAWVCERFSCYEDNLDFSDVVRCSAGVVTNSRVGIRMMAELDGRPLVQDPTWVDTYRREVLGD
jgi:branched-subunit amino acid aminotransferase/4-amino-4-deoxychorismate lyase